MDDGSLLRIARVSFAGVVREISLACVPEAQPGDYILAHAGVAIAVLDEAEALRVLATLEQLEEPLEARR
jgi:hydrogenase expression/formation protein HypC